MKYRHSFHAGNFADVHKHVTLLALLAALQRKDKGFLYLDTHAGRGATTSPPRAPRPPPASRAAAPPGPEAEELARLRSRSSASCAGPPGTATSTRARRCWRRRCCAPQDRAVLIELQGRKRTRSRGARHVQRTAGDPRTRVERGDGFQRLKA